MSDQANANAAFQLAPGETDPASETFSPSLALFWLKANMMVSSRRFVYNIPNTLLGVIPLGSEKRSFPLNNIASVDSGSRFRIGRFLGGLFLIVSGFSMSQSSGASLILSLIGLLILVNSFPATLSISNNAGGVTVITVSALEKAKLDNFTQVIQSRIFADQAGLRHEAAQQMRAQGNFYQAAQLQMMQQQYGQPQYGQPQNGQQQYGQPQNGQPQYGHPQYGHPQNGQPQYGQQQYGHGQWNQDGQNGPIDPAGINTPPSPVEPSGPENNPPAPQSGPNE